MPFRVEKTASDWLKETKKGYLRLATLMLLSKRPYHGYEILKEIKERTRGFWTPTAGGIYPILQDLEGSKYIRGEWDTQTKRKRKTYKITAAGRTVLERSLAKERQLANNLRGLFTEYMKDVLAVKTETNEIPEMPSPLTSFLEHSEEKPEEEAKRLADQQTKVKEMIRQHEKLLKAINKRLAELEKPKKAS
jgi:DNA-binding PadR family transcriptional regulator